MCFQEDALLLLLSAWVHTTSLSQQPINLQLGCWLHGEIATSPNCKTVGWLVVWSEADWLETDLTQLKKNADGPARLREELMRRRPAARFAMDKLRKDRSSK